MGNFISKGGKCYKVVYTPYITKKGKRIYPKRSRMFRFLVEVSCSSCK